jgi:hypothetical protein
MSSNRRAGFDTFQRMFANTPLQITDPIGAVEIALAKAAGWEAFPISRRQFYNLYRQLCPQK